MHRILLIPLTLMLGACASSSAPRQYERGTYRTPPRAPTFQPHEDAPHTVGRPGHMRPGIQVEPGPQHKRVLSPSREPGLWAGDEPRAALGTVPHPELFGIQLPLPDNATDADRKEATSCRNEIESAAARIGTDADLKQLRGVKLICAVAALYMNCIGTKHQKAVGDATSDEATRMALRRLFSAALTASDAACMKLKDMSVFHTINLTKREMTGTL